MRGSAADTGTGRTGPNRRTALTLGGLAVLGIPVLGACTWGGGSEPDPLIAIADAAARDAAEAAAVFAAFPKLAAAGAVAKARRTQADALRAEINRAAAITTPTATPPPSSAAPKPPGDEGRAVTRLTSALRNAQQSAGALVGTVPAYRAGLVGSVAAGCAALRELFA